MGVPSGNRQFVAALPVYPYDSAGSATLVDCSPRTTTAGDSVIAWVTVKPVDDAVELVTCTTAACNATRAPDRSKLNSWIQIPVSLRASYLSEVGPLIVKRIPADRAQDVRLGLEFAGGLTEITAVWTGESYDLKVAANSPVYAFFTDEITLMGNIRPAETTDGASGGK